MGSIGNAGCGRGGRLVARWLVALAVLGALTACQGKFPFGDHDRDAELTRDDFREALAPRPVPSTERPEAEGPPIPELQTLVELPPPVPAAARKLVSLSVNENAPLKDVLIELARKAEIDLALDPRIQGGIILTMRNRPLGEVIERIANLSGLRYEFHDNSLQIELDEPYFASYRVDYLDLARQATSSVETSTNVMGGDSVEGNASRSAVSGQSDTNFWQELEASLAQILDGARPSQLLVAAAPLVDPADDGAPSDEPGADTEADQPAATFTLNRQAGIVSVFATERQHRLVGAYLEELGRSISRQVLIEAKIFEVALSDAFQSGINWRAVIDNNFFLAAPLGRTVAIPPFNTPLDATPDVVTMALDTSNLDVIAHFIQNFGTVRTLSSPRVTVLQNQTAVLKVAENQVFFQLFFERTEQDNGDDVVNINSEIRTVPVGVVITVQPSINETTEQISLALRPTITRVTDVVDDPAVAIASNNTVQSQIPVVAVQEIDSVVTMRSGQVVVMGGLMRDITTSGNEGIPGLGQLPALGYLFSARDDQIRKTELVIFLRATILDGDTAADPVDADLYRRFSGDRRPLPMPVPTE